jgi:hypothetical protein
MNNNLTEKLELIKYHRKAMSERRNIGFKAFISLITLFLIGLKGFFELIEKTEEKDLIKSSFIICYLVLFIIYCFFIRHIEKTNKKDRIKYINLENNILSILEECNHKDTNKYTETIFQSICRSWAAIWTISTLLIITIICCIMICNYN